MASCTSFAVELYLVPKTEKSWLMKLSYSILSYPINSTIYYNSDTVRILGSVLLFHMTSISPPPSVALPACSCFRPPLDVDPDVEAGLLRCFGALPLVPRGGPRARAADGFGPEGFPLSARDPGNIV